MATVVKLCHRLICSYLLAAPSWLAWQPPTPVLSVSTCLEECKMCIIIILKYMYLVRITDIQLSPHM